MLYKLTDEYGRTRGGMQWGENVTREADRAAPAVLCTKGVIHAYTDPLLAVLLDPIHAGYGPRALLWEARGRIVARNGDLKVGCRELTTIRRIERPAVSGAQRARFAILCALAGSDDRAFSDWAARWAAREDRSVESAREAAWAAREAARTAVRAAVGTDFDIAALARRAMEG